VCLTSPDGPFTEFGERVTFLIEQFWGRAARASNDSRESDARFYFQANSPQYVDMVKLTVMRASVSTGRPSW
jgi:hypothetical protein